MRAFQDALRRKKDRRRRFARAVPHRGRVFERRGADKSCAIGAVTLDLAGADAAIREICATALTNWIALIEPPMPWALERRSDGVLLTDP